MEELQRADIEQRDRLMQAFREGYRIMTEAQQRCAHMLRHTTDKVVGDILQRAREDARNMLDDTEARCRTMQQSNEECERRAHNFWLGRESFRARVRPTAVADDLDLDDDDDDDSDHAGDKSDAYNDSDQAEDKPATPSDDGDSTTIGSSAEEEEEEQPNDSAHIVVRPSALVEDTPAQDNSPRKLLITGKKRRSADQTPQENAAAVAKDAARDAAAGCAAAEDADDDEEPRRARTRTTSFQFKRNLALIRRYRATHGEAPPGTGIEGEEFAGVAEFVRTARRQQAQRLLEVEQVERADDEEVDPTEFVTDDVIALDRSGFSWSDVALTFEQGYELLADFVKLYGHADVPRSYTSARFPGLGMWLEQQVGDMEKAAAGKKRVDRRQMKKLLCLGVSPPGLMLDEDEE